MSARDRWLKAWPLVPLLFAAFGVVARALSTDARPVALPASPARAFSPPALWLLTAHGKGVQEEFAADASTCRARLQLGSQLAFEYTLRGHLRLESDESLGVVELELLPAGANSGVRRPLRVQVSAASARSSPIPGLHAAQPSGRVFSDGEGLAVRFSASWMRLPGGRLQAHLVSEPVAGLDELGLRPAPIRAPWESPSPGVLSLLMDLHSTAGAR